LEISSESLDQVVPVRDLRRRQMLQPGPSSVREEKGEVADDEVVVVRPSQLARQPVIREP
jgi:LPS O-antigen subunit length determinant protein (WzzB/FepE family)